MSTFSFAGTIVLVQMADFAFRGDLSDKVEEIHAHPVEANVAQWISQQVEKEMARLSSLNQKCIPVPVLAMCIIRETETAEAESTPQAAVLWNHVEFKTTFDFTRVQQILLGETMPCPIKKGFTFVTTVLITDGRLPMIFGYLYDSKIKDSNLNNWKFVNAAAEKVRFKVDAFV